MLFTRPSLNASPHLSSAETPKQVARHEVPPGFRSSRLRRSWAGGPGEGGLHRVRAVLREGGESASPPLLLFLVPPPSYCLPAGTSRTSSTPRYECRVGPFRLDWATKSWSQTYGAFGKNWPSRTRGRNILDGSNQAAGAGFRWSGGGELYDLYSETIQKMWTDISTLVGGLSCVGLRITIRSPPLFSCTHPGCCSSVPSQALLTLQEAGALRMLFGRFCFWKKRTCEFLLRGDSTIFSSVFDFSHLRIHFEVFFLAVLFLYLIRVCTFLFHAHFYFCSCGSNAEWQDRCLWVYIIFSMASVCVLMQREQPAVMTGCFYGCVFERALSWIWFLWAGKRTHGVGGVFLNFTVWFSFAVFSHHYIFPPQIIYGFR